MQTPVFSTETLCFLCGLECNALKTCAFCDKRFCSAHIAKTRRDFSGNSAFSREICAKCEEIELSKQLFREFSTEKALLEQEIALLQGKERESEAELLIKTETFQGIQAAKDRFIDKLTTESLDFGQKIEDLAHENRQISREIREKDRQRREILQEIELCEQLLKESSEERSPTGYEHVWAEGLAQRREIFKEIGRNPGVCEKLKEIFRCSC